MTDDVCHHGTVLRVIVQHLSNQVLELLREIAFFLALHVCLPVLINSVAGEESVNRVIASSHLIEGHCSTAHDKENATQCK